MKKYLIVALSMLLILCSCKAKSTEEFKTEEKIEEIQETPEKKQDEENNLLYFEDEKKIWGADPGLGIDVLHSLGYKGKGSVIAYCDGKVKMDHEQFKDADIIYENFPERERIEWHGYGVLSLLIGKDIGTAPETKLYYFGYEPSDDQKQLADVIDEVIRVNKTLPEGQKIQMLGFSNNIYNLGPSRINQQLGIDAAKRCREAGIMIFFCGENGSLYYKDGTNRNDPESCYNIPQWANERFELCKVPAASRTYAMPNGEYGYDDENSPGMSWTMPYSLGVYAIATSIDPSLTEKDIRTLIVNTTFYNSRGMRIINPCEFIAVVLERVGRNEDAEILRKAYQDSLVNYDKDKYVKLQLDSSLKPFKGLILEKKLKPNSEVLEGLESPRSYFYYDDNSFSGKYEISNCKLSSTSDGEINISFNITLPKGMKAQAINQSNKKIYSQKLNKTNGNMQLINIKLKPEDYKEINTLEINFNDKENEFKVYVDIFSYLNPTFVEIKKDYKFSKEKYNYDAKKENELSYIFDPSSLTDSYVNINSITYSKESDTSYIININLTATNDMNVCMFNPPNGTVILINKQINKLVETTVSMPITKEQLNKIDKLMISVNVSDADRAFIELDTSKLKNN